MKKIKDERVYIYIVLFIIVFGILIFYFPAKFNQNNSIYAIGQIHAYDESLYLNNPTLVTGETTPRGVLNNAVALFMKAFHMEWETVIYGFLYLALVIKSIAVINMSIRLSDKNYKILAIVLALLFGKAAEMGMANFGNLSQSMGSGQGYAFALLGISFVVGKNPKYGKAWIFAICAGLCHIHEGIYSGGIIFLLWLLDVFIKRRIEKKEVCALMTWILVIIGCALPSLLTANAEIDSQTFVNIYALFRTPHHLVPSNYGLEEILKYFFLLLYPASLYLQSCRGKEYIKEEKYKIGIFVGLWIMALTFTWIFTEVIPVAMFVSLMIPKVFKYVSVLSLIGYLRTIDQALDNSKWGKAGITIFFSLLAPFVSLRVGLGLFLIVFAGEFLISKGKKPRKEYLYYSLGMILFLFVIKETPIFVLLFAMIILWLERIKKSQMWMARIVLIIGLIIGMSYGKFWVYEDSVRILTPHDYMLGSVSEEVYDLAVEFEERTDANELFISDPDRAYSDWFQVISRRSAWVTWKNIPSSKGAMNVWYQRYNSLKNLFNSDAIKLHALMKENGIGYILVKADEYVLYENCGLYKEFITSSNGNYRIYSITE